MKHPKRFPEKLLNRVIADLEAGKTAPETAKKNKLETVQVRNIARWRGVKVVKKNNFNGKITPQVRRRVKANIVAGMVAKDIAAHNKVSITFVCYFAKENGLEVVKAASVKASNTQEV